VNAAPAKAKLKVLLIEDNPGDARLMREYLSDPAGSAFEMVHSTTLAEGLAELTA
jgi:CheY-like chemotaxis protein